MIIEMPRRRPQTTELLKRDFSIGKRLAELRKKQGVTQAELSEKLGTLQSVISDYETGRLRIHAEALGEIARVLNTSADAILGIKEDGKEQVVSFRLLKRLKKIEELSDYQQKILLQTIDNFLRGAERV